MDDDEARANETTDASDQIINTPNDEPDIAAQTQRSRLDLAGERGLVTLTVPGKWPIAFKQHPL